MTYEVLLVDDDRERITRRGYTRTESHEISGEEWVQVNEAIADLLKSRGDKWSVAQIRRVE